MIVMKAENNYLCPRMPNRYLQDKEVHMELIVISNTRMKIMLSPLDMSNYDIDARTLDTDVPRTRRILYGILDDANKSAGLESSGERAFVQVFPSRDGGCEMYVTRFSELADVECTEGEYCLNMNSTKNIPKRRQVFCFRCMHDLLCACRALNLRGYSERSDSYYSEENGCIYLILGDGDVDTSVVLEYAEPVFLGGAKMYISEHATPICENEAVETLAYLC